MTTIAQAQALIAQGHGDRHIARVLNVTRHKARDLMREAERAYGSAQRPSGGTALLRYDAARSALAEAVAFDEVKDWADRAEAMRVYARQAGDVQLEQDATEIRLRAVQRFGQLELELKAAGLLHKGGRPPKTGKDFEPVTDAVTLADLGVTKAFSANAQAIAGIGSQAFEEMVVRKRKQIEDRKGRVSLDIIKEREAERRRADHASRIFDGGTVDDLRKLVAAGLKYSTILADPPWKFITRSEAGEGRSAGQHYTTDLLEEIKRLPIGQLAADDAVLLMWMVDWCPHWALDVIEAWGFAHKTTAFTWAKQTIDGAGWHMGQGYWTRANPEACWLATRGHPSRINADVRQLIVAPVMEHSRKPDEIHDRIERLVGGPYLEVYARRERAGWMTWGNELEFKMPAPEPSRVADDGSPTDPETGEILEDPAPNTNTALETAGGEP
jgi:N6-adenosine-specific RNA methylase IME4